MIKSAQRRRLIKTLSVGQVLLASWIAVWIAILIYHLFIADILRNNVDYSDTYCVVYYFGPLGISLYLSALLFCAISLVKWLLRKNMPLNEDNEDGY